LEACVAEVLVQFAESVYSEDGKCYTARACGSEMPEGKWQGWIEFVPAGPGEPVRSARETTQPNRQDTLYWATGLTPVYLEGSLHRALKPMVRTIAPEIAPPNFDGPATNFVRQFSATESVLDPYSVFRNGEPQLRRQLSALAGWHLVNIIRRYELSREDPGVLGSREPHQLVELIIDAVKHPQTTA
jgi:hypothetical protein